MREFVSKLTGLAAITGASPGRSQRGAALRLQRGSVDVDLAAVVLYRQPTRTLHAVCGAEAEKQWKFITESQRGSFLRSSPEHLLSRVQPTHHYVHFETMVLLIN